jgi:hypothetical protein
MLIYFDPFFFRDGSASKSKYFLVLKVVENTVVLASLPSSKNHLPTNTKLNHGCLELPDCCINCYIFQAARPITKDGWSFGLDTFLYGNWLDDFTIESLQNLYAIEGVDYEIIGEINEEELKNIISCFVNSSTVRRKYKRMLS